MRKWMIRIGIFLLISYLLFFIPAAYIYYKSRPQTDGELKLNGLQGKVTVSRDEYGIPHITAQKSDLDAFFALGYVHAQDRFWQMEFNRRVASGTLSEILGETTVPADKYLRVWGFHRAAETAWPALSPQSQAIIQAYTDGVNAYINQNHFPIQFYLLNFRPAPWTVIDTLAWQKVLAWDLQNIWKDKLKNYLVLKKLGQDKISELFPAYPENGPVILSSEDLKQSDLFSQAILPKYNLFTRSNDNGSNNWVISGKYTQSGKPLLANDPHLELQAPSLWYLAELKGPNLHVIGATMPGIPAVVIGHNDHIAWGVTNVNPDVQDLYILPKDSPVVVSDQIVKVRGKPDVTFPVIYSHVGPVISQVSEAGQISPYVALRWTAFEPNDTTAQSMLEINYAQNWNAFVGALKDFVTPSQNFVYADIEGNIGYYLPGKIPIRHYDSSLPIQDDQQHQWQGYIPFEKLPHVFNPPEGMIVTANNRVINDHYPYAVNFRWSVPPYRAERIINLLKQNVPLDTEKFKTIQLDNYSGLWFSLSQSLLKTQPLDKNSQIGLDYLKNWDGNTDLNSIPATIFAYWYRELGNLTPDFLHDLEKWPEPLYIENQIKDSRNSGFLSQSLKTAMEKLNKDHKNWAWKNTHIAVFNELGVGKIPGLGLFWKREIATPGGLYTVNAGTYNFKSFIQEDGAGYRQIIDLNNLNNSQYIQSMGQSNDPLDKHYKDLMALWQGGGYISTSNWTKNHTLTLGPP